MGLSVFQNADGYGVAHTSSTARRTVVVSGLFDRADASRHLDLLAQGYVLGMNDAGDRYAVFMKERAQEMRAAFVSPEG